MAKIGLNNFKYSIDGVNYHPVESVKDITLNAETTNNDFYDFVKDSETISINLKIYKKRNGTVIERWLYYHNHKKKRIRKMVKPL